MYQGTVTSASVWDCFQALQHVFNNCIQKFLRVVEEFDDDGTETVQQCAHVQSWKVFMDKRPHPAGKVTCI